MWSRDMRQNVTYVAGVLPFQDWVGDLQWSCCPRRVFAQRPEIKEVSKRKSRGWESRLENEVTKACLGAIIKKMRYEKSSTRNVQNVREVPGTLRQREDSSNPRPWHRNKRGERTRRRVSDVRPRWCRLRENSWVPDIEDAVLYLGPRHRNTAQPGTTHAAQQARHGTTTPVEANNWPMGRNHQGSPVTKMSPKWQECIECNITTPILPCFWLKVLKTSWKKKVLTQKKLLLLLLLFSVFTSSCHLLSPISSSSQNTSAKSQVLCNCHSVPPQFLCIPRRNSRSCSADPRPHFLVFSSCFRVSGSCYLPVTSWKIDENGWNSYAHIFTSTHFWSLL